LHYKLLVKLWKLFWINVALYSSHNPNTVIMLQLLRLHFSNVFITEQLLQETNLTFQAQSNCCGRLYIHCLAITDLWSPSNGLQLLSNVAWTFYNKGVLTESYTFQNSVLISKHMRLLEGTWPNTWHSHWSYLHYSKCV